MFDVRHAVMFGLSAVMMCGSALAQEEGPKEESAAKWDVDHPPYPTFEQPIDTRTGTWMSVDVSPDGEEIAFDLLGDLYLMPIAGGEARRITSGISWDMQPRFSPDGRWIAFTSDRTGKSGKGGDNIWIIEVDGGETRQITDESFRLLNGPSWHPSGEYIVARKHFTSRRSLGAGEMWMYHMSGVEGGATEGMQLTAKPTDQKDVNEPVFSPDGKYLYYSLDATPGQQFEYDKDSNGSIYAIDRLDTQKGETIRLISGAGGACRPTPSPDGKSIAFVRRVGPKTGLHLYDIASGAVTLLYGDLERDMQEAWAIHGVYPGIAWTPDSGSIVFWARGTLHRIDASTKEVVAVPFHVKDSRTVAKAQRVETEAAPGAFDVRMLRSVRISPDGGLAAFQTLGKILLRELPEGESRRLTSQVEDFEFFPSFSRDGRHVVYVSWNDQRLGEVRVAAVDGSEMWTVTTEPGHYQDPVFSPDGTTIVYVKSTGGYVHSPLWSNDPGVYRVPFRGGEATLITKDGATPQFGGSSERVFLTRSSFDKDADNTKLVSIGLDGKDEFTHFTSSWATDYALSPDGEWVAFIERFNVHVAPFVQTGKTISIGPDAKGLPVARASKEAGANIQFSGDSGSLHWSLGPTLYTRPLTDCFAFLDGAPETLPEPTAEGINLGFKAMHDLPRGSIALVGGTIVTMRGDEIIRDGTVLIERNRIKAVGTREEVLVPTHAKVIDITGQVICPGFIDTHEHGPQASGGVTPQQNWGNYARLAFGVTAFHDPSNDTESIFAAAELQKGGLIVAPRIYSTGMILYGAAGSFKASIDSLDDALFHLRRIKSAGAFSVKSYNQPRRDQRQQVMEAARQVGMNVVPEGGSTFMHNLTMIVDGHTGIEHTFPVEMVYDDVKQLWKETGVGYSPTLVVAYGGLGGENYWYSKMDIWNHERVLGYVPPEVIKPRATRRITAPDHDWNHIRQARICKIAYDLGLTVSPGGHGQLNGLATHWEMWGFEQGGMTPHEALRCGTLLAARYIGMEKDLGSIEPGKLADIVVFDKGRDPTKNIRDTEFIQYTIANGRMFDARTMNQLGHEPSEREPFYWETDGYSAPSPATTEAGCAGCGHSTLGSN